MFRIYLLHVCGIIHKRIKADNVFFNSTGEIELEGLGIGIGADGLSLLSEEPNLLTKRYLAPEIIEQKKWDIKSDIWAFGILILELAFSMEQFDDKTLNNLTPSSVMEIFMSKREYSEEMALFVSKCFERDLVKRASAVELSKDNWFKKPEVYATSGK